jgi:hypothetical protein
MRVRNGGRRGAREGAMSETIQLTPSEARRLVDGLRVTLDFIRTKIPADVIATKQTHGLERATAALKLKPNTDKIATEMGSALLWAYTFVVENYTGSAMELVDVAQLLAQLRFLDVERTPMMPDHPTKQ